MFLLGVFLIGKAKKSTGMFVGLLCILLCAYRTAFLGQMLPFKAEKLWWIGGAVFVVLLAVGVYRIPAGG